MAFLARIPLPNCDPNRRVPVSSVRQVSDGWKPKGVRSRSPSTTHCHPTPERPAVTLVRSREHSGGRTRTHVACRLLWPTRHDQK